VLLIFDCCFAGNLIPRPGRSCYPSRSFELIAACGKNKKTAWPGRDSFTSALIWALKTLVADRKRFTTLELQTKIMNGPHFPKNQFVPVGECYEPCDQRLILAPLPSDSNIGSPTSTISSHLNAEHPQDCYDYYLDLRFRFGSPPTNEEIKNLAQRFKRLMTDKLIQSHRIDWMGFKDVEVETREKVELKLIRPVADKWMSVLSPRYRRKSTIQTPVTSTDFTSTGGVLRSEAASISHTANSNFSSELSNGLPSLGELEDKGPAIEHTVDEKGLGIRIRHIAVMEPHAILYNDELGLAKNLEMISGATRGALVRIMQNTHPALRVMAALSLSVGAWYALSSGPFYTFNVE
jgi:hypothetical protein